MLILALGALAGCGGGGDDDPSGNLPLVAEIAAAIAAVEAELGGPQEYFEINATTQLVNLFVASNDKPLAAARSRSASFSRSSPRRR